jgi:hypothetical protein
VKTLARTAVDRARIDVENRSRDRVSENPQDGCRLTGQLAGGLGIDRTVALERRGHVRFAEKRQHGDEHAHAHPDRAGLAGVVIELPGIEHPVIQSPKMSARNCAIVRVSSAASDRLRASASSRVTAGRRDSCLSGSSIPPT